MYEFSDYFDNGLTEVPYTIPGEELEDYLRLLDMLLESYLEFKSADSQTKLFSRGLVITETELKGYFSMPPFFRERDISDPVMTQAANMAFSYIEKRTAATKTAAKDWQELLPFEQLKMTFDLNRTEMMGILLALSVEIDRRYERIFGYLQDNISQGTPTIGMLYALMARITPRDSSAENIPIPFDERMYTYFFLKKGSEEKLDTSLILQPLVRKLLLRIPDNKVTDTTVFREVTEEPGIPVFFDESYRELDQILSLPDIVESTSGKAVYIGNDDNDTVMHLLSHYCSEHQEKLFILDIQQLMAQDTENQRLYTSELFLRIKLYNGRLAIRYISDKAADGSRELPQNAQISSGLTKLFNILFPKYVILFGEKEEPGELAAMFIPSLRIPDATVELRMSIWEHFLNSDKEIKLSKDVVIPDLADCYEVPYGSIRKAVGHAIITAKTMQKPVIDRRLVLESLRQLNQVDFSGLATYVNPSYTWDDITITETQKEIMKTACDRYRLRNRIGEGWGLKRKNAYGNGVSILLYGPPGTGKTMAAQVIANELTLPLYRVDISQISSKYIGETEKNLALIFKAAARANVILFFDEADALFSRRTDVSDSHDKYANSETAYLLQKIEEYNGMSILATNYYNNFDDAFVRRITYSIHMESPDKDTRYMLWTSILPKTAKIEEDIDFHFFADKFDLSGSNIKAILFNAAYMAGAENKPIGPKHIVSSMEYEFTKLGKLVHASDFGDYEIYL